MAIRQPRGTTLGKGTPQRNQGQNGDLTIRSTSAGTKLYAKSDNKWHIVHLDVDVPTLKRNVEELLKEVRDLKNKRLNKPTFDAAFLRVVGSDSVKLSNDTGHLITTMDGSSGGSFKIVRDVNNGNPVFQMGSADTESFFITANYASGGKGLNSVLFNTKTAQTATGDEGQYDFYVDEVKLLNIDDSGTTAFTPGSVTNDIAALTLENNASASSMTGTGTAILFNQMYHHAETPAIVDAGKIVVRTEGNWTSTGSTQDSEMTFHTVANGTQAERLKIASDGAHTITSVANPQLKIAYTADDYATLRVEADGVTTIATADSDGTVGHLTLDIDGNLYIDVDGGTARITDDGGTYTPDHATSIATKGYVDGATYMKHTAVWGGNLARVGSSGTWLGIPTGYQAAALQMGTGSAPDTSYTTTTTADDLVACIWASMHDITVTGCKIWTGPGGATNTGHSLSLMRYDIDADGDLSNGVEVAQVDDLNNDDYTQARAHTLTLSGTAADLDVDFSDNQILIAFVEPVAAYNSALGCKVILEYTEVET